MRRLPLTCLTLLFLLACLSVATSAPVIIAGTVVGPDDKPLAEAEVWLVRITYQPTPAKIETVATIKSEAGGKFRFEPVETGSANPPTMNLLVYALKPPLAVGYQAVPRPGIFGGPPPPPGFATSAGEMKIVCANPEPLAGQIVTPEGQGIAATVSPLGSYSPELREKLAVQTAADGKFVLSLMAAALPGRSRMIEITAPGYGRVRSGGNAPPPPVIKLQPAGSLEVRFTRPAEAAQVPFLPTSYYGRGEGWTSSGSLEVDEQGIAKPLELPPGSYFTYSQNICTSPWQFPRREGLQVKSGETLRVDIPMQRAVTVTGKVFAADTGQPIEGAGVSGTEGRGEPVLTDKDGKYTLYALPGTCYVTLRTVPDGYSFGEGGRQVEVTVKETGATAEPMRVARALTVQGVTVDDKDQPVAGATIHWPGEYNYGPSRLIQPVVSDADGKFTLKQLTGGNDVTVWAEKDDLVGKEVRFKPEQPPQPLKLVMAPMQRVRLKVKVVDQDGQPVAGASISTQWWSEGGGGGRPSPPAATDATGQWLSEPQTGFGNYTLNVTCAGYDTARSPQWKAVPGETHDFGELRLTRADGSLAGTVVDQDGKPLPGIRVFNSSESPKLTEAPTGPDGRFTLTSLFPGRAFVFAESPNHLFTGVCAETGKTDVIVKLSPRPEVNGLGEPAPPGDRGEEIKAARALIDMALAAGVQPDLIGLLATIDLPEAIKRSAAANGQYDDAIAVAMGKALIADDPDGALDWCEKINDPGNYARMQAYAVVKLAHTHPDLAQRQFAKAMQLIPDLNDRPQPYPSLYLARMALAIFPVDRGLAEVAARQAQEMVDAQVPKDRESGQVRAEVAEALALFDVDAALEMVKDIPEWGDRMAHFESRVAAGCALTDPARAEQVLDMLPAAYRDGDMPRVLCPMAGVDYERAVRLARAMRDQTYQRPRTLAWLALAVRPTDAAKSWALFQEALACIKPDQLRQEPWMGSQTSRLVALLSAIGRQIGYPLSGELAWRSAGLRPSPAAMGGDWYTDQQVILLMAMAEPSLAKDMALMGAERARSGEDEWSQRARLQGAITALALADPAGAPEVVRAMLQRSGGKVEPYYWREIIQTLLADPSERLGMIARRGEGWAPGSDDLQW